MSDLFDIYAECFGNVEPRHRQWARDNGLSDAFIWSGPAPFGVAQIETRGRTFEFSEPGQRAVIVPIADDYCIDTFEHRIADLLAFFPSNPGRSWTLRDTCPVLNASAASRAELCNTPLCVWSTPLAWLQAEREGVVVLDWSANLKHWLSGPSRIWAETDFIERQIRSAMRVPFSAPDIRSGERHAA